ncbi:hypothetical protein L3V82_03530 [Thiotrichales bacterium 19S3-7]|nr:hypothetical protein [Thiotrichales bacterium 19S3-7]MCF6801282.1 hypothetical protein [Thiotrichales bacterium 19S3-11]
MLKSVIVMVLSFVFLSLCIIGFAVVWYQLDLANTQIKEMEKSWRDSVNSAMLALKYRRDLNERFIKDEKQIAEMDNHCLTQSIPDDIKRLLVVYEQTDDY